jgi:hypothetical protein
MNEHENWASPSADGSDFAAATIDELAELFRLLDLPHALTGGHAVNQYTAPRLTYDLDFVVGGGSQGALRCRRMLELIGYTLERAEGTDQTSSAAFVRMKHAARGVVVDIQEARTAFERTLLERARRFDGLPFPVASPEDLIVSKLLSDRQRDQRDVLELWAIDGLDVAYIRQWVVTWRLGEAWARLTGERIDSA